jgi:hypothetical protein
MTDLRQKVARAISDASDHSGGNSPKMWEVAKSLPLPLYIDGKLAEADAAIKAVLEALKEPSEAMVEAYNQHDLSFVLSGYHDFLRTFTRDHYLSALAEEDGKLIE